MQTDHFDLYQFHAVTTLEDVEKIFSADGAMKVFEKAREKGLTKYLGFSAHTEEAAIAMMENYNFDSVLFPISQACWQKNNFGEKVINKAVKNNMGILALKSLAKRPWREDEEHKWEKCWYKPIDTAEEAKVALRFTLSKPITAAVPPGHIELFRLANKQLEILGDEIDKELSEFNFITGSEPIL